MAIYAKVVTPSDTASLAQPGILYVGSGGDVKVITEGGDTVTFVGVVGGTHLKVLVKKVFSTDTDASNMLVNY